MIDFDHVPANDWLAVNQFSVVENKHSRQPDVVLFINGLPLADLVRDFIVFEDDGSGRIVKKMAGYYQFHAVQVAVGETLRAARLDFGATPGAGPGAQAGSAGPRRALPELRPFVPLKAAAGAFSDPQRVPDEEFEWVEVETRAAEDRSRLRGDDRGRGGRAQGETT